MQAKATIHRCERILQLQEKFKQKRREIGSSIRLAQIVDGIFHHPFVRIKDLPKKLNCTYPTAKSDVHKLVEAGTLRKLKRLTSATY